MSAAGSADGSVASPPPSSGSPSPRRDASGSDSEGGALVGAPATAASPASVAPPEAAGDSSEADGGFGGDADGGDLANAIVAASANAAASGLLLAGQVAAADSPRASQGAAALVDQGPGYLDAPVSRRQSFSDSVTGRERSGSGCSQSCCVAAMTPSPRNALSPANIRALPRPCSPQIAIPRYRWRRSVSGERTSKRGLPLRWGGRLSVRPLMVRMAARTRLVVRRGPWGRSPEGRVPLRLRLVCLQLASRSPLRASRLSKRWRPRRRPARRLPPTWP
ncbi:unnamed protein product [Ectocarpus sp. 13 AM-2016]